MPLFDNNWNDLMSGSYGGTPKAPAQNPWTQPTPAPVAGSGSGMAPLGGGYQQMPVSQSNDWLKTLQSYTGSGGLGSVPNNGGIWQTYSPGNTSGYQQMPAASNVNLSDYFNALQQKQGQRSPYETDTRLTDPARHGIDPSIDPYAPSPERQQEGGSLQGGSAAVPHVMGFQQRRQAPYGGMAANPWRNVYDNTDRISYGMFGMNGEQEDAETQQNVDMALQGAARGAYNNSAFDNYLRNVGLAKNRQGYIQALAADPTQNYANYTANQNFANDWWMADPRTAGRNTMFNRVRWSGR